MTFMTFGKKNSSDLLRKQFLLGRLAVSMIPANFSYEMYQSVSMMAYHVFCFSNEITCKEGAQMKRRACEGSQCILLDHDIQVVHITVMTYKDEVGHADEYTV